MTDLLILAGFAIAGIACVPVAIIEPLLRHYVSREKVHTVEDLKKLWNAERPPKITLDDKGLKLRKFGNAAILVFLAALFTNAFGNVFEFSTGQNIVGVILIGSFAAIWIIESRLKHHISRDRVLAIDDVSKLWRVLAPPEVVLNDKGLRLYRYRRWSAILFFTGMGIVFFGAIFGHDLPRPEEIGIGSSP